MHAIHAGNAHFTLADLRLAAEHPLASDLEGPTKLLDASLMPLPWRQLQDLRADPTTPTGFPSPATYCCTAWPTARKAAKAA